MPDFAQAAEELYAAKDGPAIRDTLIWFAALVVAGGLAWHFWGSWWCVPFFVVYGVLYGSSSDSPLARMRPRHRLQDALDERRRSTSIACFMVLREPTVWRWSHTRHHTDTIIVGRDPEIGVAAAAEHLHASLLNLFAPQERRRRSSARCCSTPTGRLTADEATFIPERSAGKVYLVARI